MLVDKVEVDGLEKNAVVRRMFHFCNFDLNYTERNSKMMFCVIQQFLLSIFVTLDAGGGVLGDVSGFLQCQLFHPIPYNNIKILIACRAQVVGKFQLRILRIQPFMLLEYVIFSCRISNSWLYSNLQCNSYSSQSNIHLIK